MASPEEKEKTTPVLIQKKNPFHYISLLDIIKLTRQKEEQQRPQTEAEIEQREGKCEVQNFLFARAFFSFFFLVPSFTVV